MLAKLKTINNYYKSNSLIKKIPNITYFTFLWLNIFKNCAGSISLKIFICNFASKILETYEIQVNNANTAGGDGERDAHQLSVSVAGCHI